MALRVLVVDDEPDIVDLMTIWLEDDPRCKAVERAETLEQALVVTQACNPDVILLDFRLGGQTSATVLPALRSTCPEAKIIIHTANHEEADRAHVIALGADAILEKATVSVDQVVEAVLSRTASTTAGGTDC